MPHTVWTANPNSKAKPSSTLKAYADSQIVITLPPGLTIIFTVTNHQKPTLQRALCYSRPIVATIAMRKVATILQPQSSFKGHNLRGLTLTILKAQSIRSRLYSVHYRDGKVHTIIQVHSRLNCLDKDFLPRRDKSNWFKLLVYGLYT